MLICATGQDPCAQCRSVDFFEREQEGNMFIIGINIICAQHHKQRELKVVNMLICSFRWCFAVVPWSHCKNRERIEGTVKAHGCCHRDP